MDEQVDVMEPFRARARERVLKCKTDVRDETGRIDLPDFFQIQRRKQGVIFNDAAIIVVMKRDMESVRVGRDPEEQDQEHASSNG